MGFSARFACRFDCSFEMQRAEARRSLPGSPSRSRCPERACKHPVPQTWYRRNVNFGFVFATLQCAVALLQAIAKHVTHRYQSHIATRRVHRLLGSTRNHDHPNDQADLNNIGAISMRRARNRQGCSTMAPLASSADEPLMKLRRLAFS